MAPYLFFIMSVVSSTWRRPPPSLLCALGTAEQQTAPPSLRYRGVGAGKPRRVHSLGDDASVPSVPSEFRFSELENFDLVNWDPSVPRRPVNVRESELLSTVLSPSQYPMF